MATYTVDTLFDPPLVLHQPKTGYRFSLDPLILAAHILPEPGDRILDIGCGCGILGLILAGRNPDALVWGVEIQKDLADLARKNAALNHMDDRVFIRHQDIRTLPATGMPGTGMPDTEIPALVDRVVSNPPYMKTDAGRLNPHPGKAQARHEITLDLPTLVDRACFFLRPRGSLHLIYPASRTQELTAVLDQAGFGIQWQRSVYFRSPDTARRVLVCAEKSGTGKGCHLPPLHLYQADGTPANAYSALFQW